jgi:poly-beta-1,6-N-acetyl-D-glucosamine synthase
MITIAFIVLLVNLFYASLLNGYRKQWSLIRMGRRKEGSELPEVTLIIPFRNERQNLPTIISCLQNLDYPDEKLKLIFVNDHSDDRSENIPELAEIKFRKEVIISNGEGKKAALNAGIEKANTEWIVTTDADVKFDSQWLKKLFSVEHLSEVEMICGMVLIRNNKERSSLLSVFQEMEFDMLQATGMAALAMHQPLLNSGANLAFKKKSWQDLGGYSAHSNILSGDDTFLMFAMQERFGDVIVGNTEAVVETKPSVTWSEFIQQRQRWASKGKYYKNKYVKTVGAIVMLSSLFLPILYFELTIPEIGMILATSIIVRAVTEIRLIRKVSQTTGKSYAIFELIGMSVFYPFFLLFLTLSAPFNKSQWKGRKL